MTTIVVLFNLKAGVSVAEYEAWAQGTDLPNVTALPSVRSFRVLRAGGLLNGATAPYQYVELIELSSLEGFRGEVKSDTMQGVAREFRAFADAPLFVVTQSMTPAAITPTSPPPTALTPTSLTPAALTPTAIIPTAP
jgi:hypothetical protein